MEEYVKDNFINRDHIKRTIRYSLVKPMDAYSAYNFSAPLDFFNDTETAMEGLFDFEGDEELRENFKKLMESPIAAPPAFDTEHLEGSIKKFADDFKNVRSLSDAMKAIGGMGDFINDKNYTQLNRKLFEGYVNRDDYSYEKWSFEFDERLKDTTYGKTFSELVDQMTTGSDKGDEYQIFLNTYIALETFGVTQERTGKKQQLKKNSFMDLNKDAAHAFFASKSDYFVSDDLGVQQKAFITYKMMGITTQVLSPNDFVERAPLLIANEGSADWLSEQITTIIETGKIVQESEDGAVLLREVNPPLYNYFNRLQYNQRASGSTLQLFRNRPQTIALYSEMALIIEKLARVFGPPLELPMLDYTKSFKDYELGEPIRVWSTPGLMLNLQLEQTDYGKNFLLFNFIPLSSTDTEVEEQT